MSRWRLWRRTISLRGRRRADASAYLDRELSGRERERFEAQFEQSPEIREYVEDIALIQSQLSMLREARPSRSFELSAADVAPAQQRLDHHRGAADHDDCASQRSRPSRRSQRSRR